jgi:predicted TIM-barrel fold metal-dependent hydrolase
MKGTDHFVVISSDCHAGASLETYRGYLDTKWQAQFDDWRGAYKNPFRDLQGDGRTRNWDDERRFSDQDGEGVVAEVIFPNTVPPFFPTGSVIAPAPAPDEYERRRVGIQAHNRWLADFCAVAPNRRAGQTQIFLNDVDDAIEDAIWGHEHGLKGVLLPGVSPDTPWIEPLYHPKYDPLWRVCEERGIPLSHHAGGTGIPQSPQLPCSVFMFVMETGFWANRALWHFVLSGVFERFPALKLVLTEQGSRWIPGALNQMDTMHAGVLKNGRIGELGIDESAVLKKMPSEYFRSNVYVGSAFPGRGDADVLREVGIERVMWGSDYPHVEATSPYSKESLRWTFEGWTPDELQRILSGTAAEVYGFDVPALQPLADEYGPTVDELATPLTEIPDTKSLAFTR